MSDKEMTMVEHVARAIMANPPKHRVEVDDEGHETVIIDYEPTARTPTAAMLGAASKECVAFDYLGNCVDMDEKDAADAYRAMIDAALNEKES